MADIGKVNGVTAANLGKVNGVAIANIGKVNTIIKASGATATTFLTKQVSWGNTSADGTSGIFGLGISVYNSLRSIFLVINNSFLSRGGKEIRTLGRIAPTAI